MHHMVNEYITMERWTDSMELGKLKVDCLLVEDSNICSLCISLVTGYSSILTITERTTTRQSAASVHPSPIYFHIGYIIPYEVLYMPG